MEYPEIEIGFCSHKKGYSENFKDLLGSEELAIFCLDHNEIVLGKRITDSLIERTLNHETIHWVLYEILGKHECITFDNLFYTKSDMYGAYGQQGEPMEIIKKISGE